MRDLSISDRPRCVTHSGKPKKMSHLLAYADRWSVAPSEAMRFFVSSPNSSLYEAQLVRLRQPEAGPLASPFHPEPVKAPLNGQHRGRPQRLPIGSAALVPNFDSFATLDQFTLTAAVFPTTPGKGRQALIGTWCEQDRTGIGLEIGADQALNLRVGTGHADPLVLSTGTGLASHSWFRVTVVVAANTILLLQEPLDAHDFRLRKPACVSAARPGVVHAPKAALTMAAWLAGAADTGSGHRFACHFNGRIEGPAIAIGALDPFRIGEWLERSKSEQTRSPVFAAWDFGQNIPEDAIIDVGPQGMHGHLINSPTRGVTGHNWSGEVFNWRYAPHEYGAIHFHDDDLTDACWSADFEFQVPAGMRSGIYAVRLTDEREEAWVPFVVRPPRREAGSDVALLLPTMTYLAYLNHRARFMSLASERLHGRLKVLDATDIAFIETPEIGLSSYDRHSDGSGVTCSSRLRPATNLRPTGHLWNFSLDLFIVDWLEHIDCPYDVITDEDLHQEGAALLRPYRVLITGTHPEYASKAMLNALEVYLNRGGRLMYLGGNGFYCRAVFHPQQQGLIEVRRSEGVRSWDTAPGEQTTRFTGENSGIWRKNGRPPQSLVGVGYVAQGFNKCSYYVRMPSAKDPRISWAFDGVISNTIGNDSVLLGGAAGYEIDSANLDLGTPEHALIIARSENHTNAYELASEEVLTPHGATDGISTDDIHADMVFFETPGGGAVFSTGSIAYAAALCWNGFDNDLFRLTSNVLRRFRQEASFPMPPHIG
jgi:N,N-dimethylformamidase beta subunit-like protein